ncbi:hypothetical protein E3T55_18960 [Cryobacterium frigoriphilum]|uniref:Uncharacterized protein n=1 Tax=Cryobacterium frigoriphilum TaxID=1259150 RepID=A0A4R8ZTX9_9MICO|nr:hypothetical protein E3T55_18960 [Cryobacterium frigoriphilum]
MTVTATAPSAVADLVRLLVAARNTASWAKPGPVTLKVTLLSPSKDPGANATAAGSPGAITAGAVIEVVGTYSTAAAPVVTAADPTVSAASMANTVAALRRAWTGVLVLMGMWWGPLECGVWAPPGSCRIDHFLAECAILASG